MEASNALAGKVALITGAGSGIGRGTAELLASRGMRVGVLSRTADQVQEVADGIVAGGGDALALVADVSRYEQMADAVDALVNQWGELYLVFANAGINGVWAPIDEMTPAEWDTTIDINLKGTLATIGLTVPHLKKTRGAIVVCSSVQGTRVFSISGASVYASTKAAQVALVKMLAPELALSGVRINAVCPGSFTSEIGNNTFPRKVDSIRVKTDFPDGRIPLTGTTPGRADQIGKLVAFLGSDEADHISGTELWIDGAESLVVG